MIEKIKRAMYGFRKVFVMLIVIFIAILFRVQDRISGDNFTELLKVTVTAFFASNLGKGIIEAIKSKVS